jgi:hypothetical protein
MPFLAAMPCCCLSWSLLSVLASVMLQTSDQHTKAMLSMALWWPALIKR